MRLANVGNVVWSEQILAFGLYRDHDPIAFLHVIPGSNWTIAGLLGEICLFNPDNTELTPREAFLPIGIKGNYICTSYPSKSPGVVMLALMASGSRWSSFSKTHYGSSISSLTHIALSHTIVQVRSLKSNSPLKLVANSSPTSKSSSPSNCQVRSSQ